MKKLEDIKNYSELSSLELKRDANIEAIRRRRNLYRIVIKLNVGIISILLAVYAIYLQF